MNMHVPQSPESRAEITEIMMVPLQIMSPRSNQPVMGIVQDTLTASTKFTQRDTFLSIDMVMNLLMWLPDWNGKIPQPAVLKPKPLWTGKQIFGLLIPGNVNLARHHSMHDDAEARDVRLVHLTPSDGRVLIEHGELLTGIICKKTLGASPGSLIHVLFKEYGPTVTRDFFNSIQWVLNYWLMQEGHSIGIKDAIADAETNRIILETITKAKQDVKEIIIQAQEGRLEPQPGNTLRQTFENKVNEKLNAAREDAGKRANRSLGKFNLVDGGCGQQGLVGEHLQVLARRPAERRGQAHPVYFRFRTLPHFIKDDYGPNRAGLWRTRTCRPDADGVFLPRDGRPRGSSTRL